MSACPSGVRYDELIERVRPEVERQHTRPARRARTAAHAVRDDPAPAAPAGADAGARGDQAVGRARSAAAGSGRWRRSRRRLRRAPGAAPSCPPALPRGGEARGRVALLLGCVQRVFFADVHRATIGVLAAEGFEVLTLGAPDCCGALELHAGRAGRRSCAGRIRPAGVSRSWARATTSSSTPPAAARR